MTFCFNNLLNIPNIIGKNKAVDIACARSNVKPPSQNGQKLAPNR